MGFISRRNAAKAVERAHEHSTFFSVAYRAADVAKRLEKNCEVALTASDGTPQLDRVMIDGYLAEATLQWERGAKALIKIDTVTSRPLAGAYLRHAVRDSTRVEEAWRAEGFVQHMADTWQEKTAELTRMHRKLQA